MQSLHYPVCI
ncbi:NUMB phenylalanine-rich region family protein, partial [Trichinella spiralis]